MSTLLPAPTRRRRRVPRRAAPALLALGAVLAAPAGAPAGDRPSNATQLTIGQPYTFSSYRMNGVTFEWMRLPAPLKVGEKLNFAVAAEKRARFCLVGATDDFGLTAANTNCDRPGMVGTLPKVDVNGQTRQTITWPGPGEAAFLIAIAEYSAAGGRPIYTVVPESVTPVELPPGTVPTGEAPTPAPAPVPAPAPAPAPTPWELDRSITYTGATYSGRTGVLTCATGSPGAGRACCSR